MGSDLVKKTIDLEELLKRESSRGKQEDSGLADNVQQAQANLFNALQDLKQMKSEGDFAGLKELKDRIYDDVVKCKSNADQLIDFLDFLGDVKGGSQKPAAGGSGRRRYMR